MKTKLIFNPRAGGSNEKLAAIKEYFPDIDVYLTIDGKKTIAEVRRTHSQYDLILAAGGDGTINEVANGLVGSSTVLGILPLGTENVIARELGIPLDLHSALNVIRNNTIHSIDVGRANKRYFLLCCGIGLDAHVIHDVGNPSLFKKIVFLSTFVKKAFTHENATLHTTIAKENNHAKMIVVSNMKRYAGEIILGHHIHYDDGYLDVSFFKDMSMIRTLTTAFVGLTTGVVLHQEPQRRVKKVRITSREPVLVHADAEIIGRTPVEIAVVPKALKLIIP